MHRRRFLAALGVAGAGAVAGCSGRFSSGNGATSTGGPTSLTLTPGPTQSDQLPADQSPDDGYPPDFEEQPPAQDVGDGHFRPYGVDGGSVMNASSDVTVTLASIDAAYYWYARGETRVVDARPSSRYEASHVFGAVSSPYNSQIEGTPVANWPTDDRVVCYCACPHHQSSIRAAELQQYGFSEVYVINEGFVPWLRDRSYPVAGNRVESVPAPRYVEGRTDPADAGETAWAYHRSSDYTEATKIQSDGRYRMGIRLADADAPLRIETPSYTVTGTLADLVSGVVTAP